MQIDISSQHLEITPSLDNLINNKLKKVQSHLQTITSIHIVLKVDKLLHIAEANVLFPKHTIHAQARSDDMYKTLDLLIDKLVRQVTKYKEKLCLKH